MLINRRGTGPLGPSHAGASPHVSIFLGSDTKFYEFFCNVVTLKHTEAVKDEKFQKSMRFCVKVKKVKASLTSVSQL
jgi:hypothetical protein